MPLYHKDVALPQGDIPVGYLTSGLFATSSQSQSPMPVMPASGSTDTTTFSPFFVPNAGTYSLTYFLSSFTSGSVQEAIFTYRPDLLGVGNTIINQNWVPTSTTRHTIDNLVFTRGHYWISLRISNGGAHSVHTNGLAGSTTSGAQDNHFYLNVKRINTTGFNVQTGNRAVRLWDNSITPTPTVINYNGSLSDFSPYQNVSNKYLFSNNTEHGYIRVKLRRTA